MSKEIPQPTDSFGLTEQERLDERISQERFTSIMTDERTAVHHIEVSANDDGEFLFVTMSQPVGEERRFLTFWGLGYHASGERRLIDEWRFYDTQQLLHQIPQRITPEDAQAWIQQRRDEIAPSIGLPLEQ